MVGNFTIDNLHDMENGYTVESIIREYTGIKQADLLGILLYDQRCLLDMWASDNSITTVELFDLIEQSLSEVADFKIISDCRTDGMVYAEMDLNGIIIEMYWDIED